MIYFDNASTSYPKSPSMLEGIGHYLDQIGANPNRGTHKLSSKGNEIVIETRKLLAQILGVKNHHNISFTYNATYALNILLKGFLKEGDHVIISSFEHNSVLRPLHHLKKTKNISYDIWKCNKKGGFDLNELHSLIQPKTRLVFLSHCSNVIGSYIPIKEITKVVKQKNIFLGLDCTQSIGHTDINIDDDQVDFIAGTGHKGLLGPPGIGFLYVKDCSVVDSLIHGSGGFLSSSLDHPDVSPSKYEAGTINYLGIAGLCQSIKWTLKNKNKIYENNNKLVLLTLSELNNLSGLKVYGEKNGQRSPIISFNVDGFLPSEIENTLDEKFDIIVRSGIHCAPLIHEVMGTVLYGSIRVSFGPYNTEKEVLKLIAAISLIQRTNS